jgi:hypothetical protein
MTEVVKLLVESSDHLPPRSLPLSGWSTVNRRDDLIGSTQLKRLPGAEGELVCGLVAGFSRSWDDRCFAPS